MNKEDSIHTCHDQCQRPACVAVRKAYEAGRKDGRKWQGLTDEEIIKLQHLIDWTAHWSTQKFAHAIEAKLKEKNG